MNYAATQAEALAAIQKMITKAEVEFPGNPQTDTKVEITVKHPTRKLTLNSFANGAKKMGWDCYGTKSATNRNVYIALFVNVSATLELYVKSVKPDGRVCVEARQLIDYAWHNKKQKLERRLKDYKEAQELGNEEAKKNAFASIMDEYVVGDPHAAQVLEFIEREFQIINVK